MKAYVMIKIRPGEIIEAIRQMRDVSGVVEASMTFGPYDAVARVEGGDLHSRLGKLSPRASRRHRA